MDKTAVVLGVIGAILSGAVILAIYYGPIKALKVQRTLDAEREGKKSQAEHLQDSYEQPRHTADIP